MNTMADGAAQRLVAQIGDIDLPKLPPKEVVDTHLPTGVRIYGYTAEQMQDYARAARQQVGAAPLTDAMRTVAYDAIDRFLRNNMDDAAYAEYVEHLEALWSAVPAQAVDLVQFREAITREYANSRALCDMSRILECERLLALIDKAVGNGN